MATSIFGNFHSFKLRVYVEEAISSLKMICRESSNICSDSFKDTPTMPFQETAGLIKGLLRDHGG